VLDGFTGSGTTLLAAERTGRVGYGLEIEPRYVDAAIRRLAEHAGLDGCHVETGRSFRQMAESRAEETDSGSACESRSDAPRGA
jgi:tRNA/tmRNA/rRNA uracil-C5-methylase (TrmA/RlmC/RlmD family)